MCTRIFKKDKGGPLICIGYFLHIIIIENSLIRRKDFLYPCEEFAWTGYYHDHKIREVTNFFVWNLFQQTFDNENISDGKDLNLVEIFKLCNSSSKKWWLKFDMTTEF